MTSPLPSSCPIARAAQLIGDEWILLILRELFKRSYKFDELQRATKAATNILTNRLKRMLAAGIVVKVPYQDRPVRYKYRLTKAGIALLPVALELMRYGEEWMPSDQKSALQIRHLGCGKVTRPGQICSECGVNLSAENLRLESTQKEEVYEAMPQFAPA